MARQQRGKVMKNVQDSLHKGAEDGQNISIFGRCSGAELVARLRRIALDPCGPHFTRDKIRPLRNGILRVRKMMALADSEIPWRKRKLEQFFKDKRRAPCFGSPDRLNPKKVRKQLLSNASSVSCLLNSVDSTQFDDEKTLFDSHTSTILRVGNPLPEIQVSTECSSLDVIGHWDSFSKGILPLVDTDESVSGSNPISDPVHNLNSSMSNDAHRRHFNPPQQPITFLNPIGDDHLQRKAVPVGPRFQADVPEWTGTVDKAVLVTAYKNDSNNSKWLGSRIWPINMRNMKVSEKTIGKGRPSACTCQFRGSVDCIKRHISGKRLVLQSELGPAFVSWKFDEMGEQVSNSWSVKDKKSFDSLVKMRPSSNGNDFVKRILKHLPSKCRKEIVNYYFNVYIPHRMSLETRSPSIKQMDTDDEDEAQDSRYLGMQKRSKKVKLMVHNSKAKDVKCHLRS